LSNCVGGTSVTFNSTDTGNTQLYAKWECVSGYEKYGNVCVAQTSEQPTGDCSSTNLGACDQPGCTNLGNSYKWCSTADDTTLRCRLASDCPNYVQVTIYNQ
jgi:hypothetical protein